MAALLATTLVGSTVARADTTEDLLEQLKAKGILTKGEYTKLKDRHAREKAAAKSTAVATAPSGGNGRYVTAIDKGIGIRIPGQQIVTKDNGVVSVGDVDIKISGNLIFFGVEQFKTSLAGTANDVGGIAGGFASAGSTMNNANAIRSGLLPSAFVVSLATNQMGYDLGFTLGVYTGGNNVNVGAFNANNAGYATALGTPGIDLRQIFGTIGTPEWGTFKIGRDLGVFAGDAILNDFTLLGVGTPAGTAQPGNTTLGRIGVGYVYADWIPQVSYTTPDWNGFTATLAMMTPYNAINSTGTGGVLNGVDLGAGVISAGNFAGGVAGVVSSGTMTAHDQPQFQGRIKYVGKFAPDIKLTAWTSGVTQQQRVEYGDLINATPGTRVRSSAFDGGARLDWGPVSVMGYGYWGSGLGTTALFWSGIAPDGSTRTSYGWFAQAQYTFFDRLSVGGSYGASILNANGFDYTQPYATYMLRSNQSAVGFVRYKLTDWVAFQGEFINTLSTNQSGGRARSNAVVGGTTFFF
ncbi:porin [Methylocella sp.]|uniref:porin n=1 Tax=Methylocella sp. TaxID=1978226 RepID=UPI0037848693